MGRPTSDEYQMNSYTDNAQRNVHITAGVDGFIATWESFGQGVELTYGVFVRSFDVVYGISSSEFQMSVSGERWQLEPAVAAAGDGRFVGVWKDDDGMGGTLIKTRLFVP